MRGAAAEFCRHLREAFERTVEECVFNDVVTRRHDTIRISKLRKVAWSEEICDLVDRGTDESSPWMHDRPRADGSEPPTPTELREGLEILEALLKAIKEHRRSGEPTDPPKAKLEAVKRTPTRAAHHCSSKWLTALTAETAPRIDRASARPLTPGVCIGYVQCRQSLSRSAPSGPSSCR